MGKIDTLIFSDNIIDLRKDNLPLSDRTHTGQVSNKTQRLKCILAGGADSTTAANWFKKQLGDIDNNGLIEDIIGVIKDLVNEKRYNLSAQEIIKRLREQSLTDPLTKLPNRRDYDEKIQQYLKHVKRTGASISLLMIDIDHFKNFNDTYGHKIGDKTLRIVAECLKKFGVPRTTDFIGRYGGEEFVAILPSTDMKNGFKVAERCRKAIEEKATAEIRKEPGLEDVKITISVGVASVPKKTEENNNHITEKTIYEKADAALYQAKKLGRNKVIGLSVSNHSTDQTDYSDQFTSLDRITSNNKNLIRERIDELRKQQSINAHIIGALHKTGDTSEIGVRAVEKIEKEIENIRNEIEQLLSKKTR